MRPCQRCGGPMLQDGDDIACLHCGGRVITTPAVCFLERLAAAVERQAERDARRRRVLA